MDPSPVQSSSAAPAARTSFPPVFWVANIIEVFELFAYYGIYLRTLCATTIAAAGLCLAAGAEAELRLGLFSADVTVPMGHGMMGGAWLSRSVADPLEAHGLVLQGLDKPVVFVAVDWCEIRNDAFERWQRVLGEAAGTEPERVMVCTVHQHDAPVADLGAERILRARGAQGTVCDPAFHEVAVQRVAQALRESLSRTRRVTHLGLGAAQVESVASNRRYLASDGSVRFDRTSSTRDAAARAAPENLIDPWLKTLSFWDGETPVVAVSAYAVHPMSYYGQGDVSADFPGLARRLRQQEMPGVRQIYLTGCGGNLTAGKYNDGAVTNRPVLAERLRQAMAKAWTATRRVPLGEAAFRVERVRLEPRDGPGFTVKELGEKITSEPKPFHQCLAAMGWSWRQRVDAGHRIEIPCLDLGAAQWLVLPGETYIEFQLAAQRMRPESFVLVAGYGEGATGYIPTERHIAEGDGNLTDWSWVAPGSEGRLLEAIRRVLRVSDIEVSRAPWKANMPIALVKKELCLESPAPRVAPWVSVQYVGAGHEMREVRGIERESDVGEEIRARWSEDNGRTWSAFVPVQPSNKVDYRGVDVWEGEGASVYDPVSGLLVQLWLRQIEVRGVYHNFTHVRTSADRGRTWSDPIPLRYEAGEAFDPDAPLDAGFLGRNEGYPGNNILRRSDGTLLVCLAHANAPGDSRNDSRPWRMGSICFLGAWDPDSRKHAWTPGGRVEISPEVSARGLMEPELAELRDGRILVVWRGSTHGWDGTVAKTPGRKFHSLSSDGGRTLGVPAEWKYDDGSAFYSPSSFHRMLRHSGTGKLYWIGNISAEAPSGNSPRHPLVIAEVDEEKAALKRATVTAIDDRQVGQGDIKFSNLPLIEDRVTHDLVLHITTYGQEPDPKDWATAVNYRYTIALRP
ncbi:MAG TPA: sialidase family protein [Verrucomicrobiota bacterium]|nr:sialidase family protein [Verrucomicrobiota bacterium]HOA62145.1 sialidase family protein [Verrucomicrobiota bacterium]HOF49529.1 sialidase family protein [Verrucomicrobiota bacterium]HOG86779.1 sialidase family protein [Verrucomicrobiota bacterium]HOR70537.1 sialidase family protein [Verrucomicrobiota bacterium]